ncbi:MAG: branched-chain amino acid ABC transporter substrate-binding protein [Pseudomonadota bacterium]
MFECTDPLGCVHIAPDAPVRFGILQALSGKVRPLGLEQIRGIELALDARGNKVAGHPVALQTEDTGCTAEGGTNSALKVMANPQTLAIIGTTCSTAGAAASREVAEAGMVMISGNNSAPFLTSIRGKKAPNWQEGYFRTACNEENAGKAAALYAFGHLGVHKAAVVNDGDIYTAGLTDGFHAAFEKLGGLVVLSTTVNKGDSDMAPVLEAVRISQADMLFFPLFQPEGNRILAQARQTPGLENLILMSDGALIEASFLAAMGEAALGMYFVGPATSETTAGRDLALAYEQKYKTRPMTTYYLSAFDAASLLFTAVEACTTRDTDGTLHMGREALRKTLYATRNFKGVTGNLNCDPFGDCASPRFNILRLDSLEKGLDGLLTNSVYTYQPETGDSLQ